MQIATATAETRGISLTEPLKLTKRVGSTTYTINVFYGAESHEKPEDKVLRIIKREVGEIA